VAKAKNLPVEVDSQACAGEVLDSAASLTPAATTAENSSTSPAT